MHAAVRPVLALQDLLGLLAVRGDRPLINLDPDGDAHARLAVERGHQATVRFAAAAHFLCTGRPSASLHTTWFRRPWVGIPRPQNAHFITRRQPSATLAYRIQEHWEGDRGGGSRQAHPARCGARSY